MTDESKLKEILILYIKSEISKKQLKEKLSTNGIDSNTFNKFILEILDKNFKNSENKSLSTKYNVSIRSIFKNKRNNTLKTNKFITNTFLEEIKNKTQNNELLHYREDDIIYENNIFTTPYKRFDILDIDIITFRVEAACKAHGLELRNNLMDFGEDIPSYISEICTHLCKSIIDTCTVKETGHVDEIKMISIIKNKFPLLKFMNVKVEK